MKKSIKKFVVSEDVEIVANGQRILLETGDEIGIESGAETMPPLEEVRRAIDIARSQTDRVEERALTLLAGWGYGQSAQLNNYVREILLNEPELDTNV